MPVQWGVHEDVFCAVRSHCFLLFLSCCLLQPCSNTLLQLGLCGRVQVCLGSKQQCCVTWYRDGCIWLHVCLTRLEAVSL